MQPFVILINNCDELYDRFDEVLFHRPDGNCFRLYSEDDLNQIIPDLLIEPLDGDDSTKAQPSCATKHIKLAAQTGVWQINYILNELYYSRCYYPRVVLADNGQRFTQGDIHTITRIGQALLLDPDYGHCTITDPCQVRELLASPILYPAASNTYISHRHIDYPALSRLLELKPDHYCPAQAKYRRRDTRCLGQPAPSKRPLEAYIRVKIHAEK